MQFKVAARQVLDSRGNPTVEVVASKSASVSAIAPSGASTGVYEAKELRDGGTAWQGKGVLQAVRNVNTVISQALSKKDLDQEELDKLLVKLDGTPDKSRLGANAIVAVSMAFSKLQAAENNIPLYQHIAKSYKTKARLPVVFANVINGGKHAASGLAMQEFMIAPQAKQFSKAIEDISNTYHSLKEVIAARYSGSTGVGDEGGFAPPITTAEEALQLLHQACEESGAKLRFAIDAASSEFYDDKKQLYRIPMPRTIEQMHELYLELVKQFRLVSLEDPFEQHSFQDFAKLRKALKAKKLGCQVVGDDLTVTNPARIKEAIKAGSCDCLLLKVNQIGTVTEAVEAWRTAVKAKWNVMVSHRSGESEDSFIAHLATGLGTGQIKIGAPCRGERTAKYNELLRISESCKSYSGL